MTLRRAVAAFLALTGTPVADLRMLDQLRILISATLPRIQQFVHSIVELIAMHESNLATRLAVEADE